MGLSLHFAIGQRNSFFLIGFSTLKDRSTLLTQTQQFLFIYLDTLMNLKTAAFANVADAISEQKWFGSFIRMLFVRKSMTYFLT